MSIEYLQRIKALEAENALLKARLDKLEGYMWGQELSDDAEEAENQVPKRRPGRPRKTEQVTVG